MIQTFKRKYKVGLFFLLAIGISLPLVGLFQDRFEENQWKTNPTERHKMIDDLFESKVLTGKTKTEVISILGEPFSKSNTKKDIFIYNIGDPPSFFKSRKEHLLIIFVNQKVNKVTLAYE